MNSIFVSLAVCILLSMHVKAKDLIVDVNGIKGSTKKINSKTTSPEQEELVIGIAQIYPWFYKESGKIKGMIYQLLEDLSQKTNINFRYAIAPYSRVKKEFKKNKYDLIPDLANSSVKKYGERLGTLFNDVSLTVVGKKDAIGFFKSKKLKNGKKQKLCRIRGIDNLLTEYEHIVSYYSAGKVRQCIQMLSTGRVDLLLMSQKGYDIALKEKRLQDNLVSFEFIRLSTDIFVRKGLDKNIKERLSMALKKP